MRDALATHRPFRCKKRSRTRQIFPTRKRIENPFAETRFARVSTRPLHVRKKKFRQTRERRTQDSVKRLVVDIARFRRPSFSLSFLARVPAKKNAHLNCSTARATQTSTPEIRLSSPRASGCSPRFRKFTTVFLESLLERINDDDDDDENDDDSVV